MELSFWPADIGEIVVEAYQETAAKDYTGLLSESQAFKQDLQDLVLYASNNRYRDFQTSKFPMVVIFIDDLDRCAHIQVRRLLESIKLFLQSPGIMFVTALDEEQVLRALGQPYTELLGTGEGREEQARQFANRYLEKFFQLTIDLSVTFSPMEDSTEDLKAGLWYHLCDHLSRRLRRPVKKFDVNAPLDRDSEFRYLLYLWEILDAIKVNPRALKGVARHIYFAYPDHKSAPIANNGNGANSSRNREEILREVLHDFSELAFQSNFGFVWVNEFQKMGRTARRNTYTSCLSMLTDAFDTGAIRGPRLSDGDWIKTNASILQKISLIRASGNQTLKFDGPRQSEIQKRAEELAEEIDQESDRLRHSCPELLKQIEQMARRGETDALWDLFIILTYASGRYEE